MWHFIRKHFTTDNSIGRKDISYHRYVTLTSHNTHYIILGEILNYCKTKIYQLVNILQPSFNQISNLWAVVGWRKWELMLICVVPLMHVQGDFREFSGSLVGLKPRGIVNCWNSILKLNLMFMASLDLNQTHLALLNLEIQIYNYFSFNK